MVVRKVTITMDKNVLATLRRLAEAEGLPLSTHMTRAAEHHARGQDGLSAMWEWEDEHGAFSPDEDAEADADIARAKAAFRMSHRHSG